MTPQLRILRFLQREGRPTSRTTLSGILATGAQRTDAILSGLADRDFIMAELGHRRTVLFSLSFHGKHLLERNTDEEMEGYLVTPASASGLGGAILQGAASVRDYLTIPIAPFPVGGQPWEGLPKLEEPARVEWVDSTTRRDRAAYAALPYVGGVFLMMEPDGTVTDENLAKWTASLPGAAARAYAVADAMEAAR